MSDLISRSELLKSKVFLCGGYVGDEYARGYMNALDEVENEINNQPSVEPVRGEWRHLGGDEWCCTQCGFVITTEGSWEKPEKKFCEECGADMRKKV